MPRYDRSEDYFSAIDISANHNIPTRGGFELSTEKQEEISELLKAHGLGVNSQEMFGFVGASLEAREYSKFLFTRCLSDAMELVASIGEELGFSREDISHLDMEAVRAVRGKGVEFMRSYWNGEITRNRREYILNGYLSIPPIFFSEGDLEVVTYYDSRPNYITNKRIEGSLVLLDEGMQREIAGKVVLLEAADPGYDWVFAKRPAALITKYGGPASHMAIRCAELGLPAIIGAGDMLYESLLHTNSVILDCENQRIESRGIVD